MIVHEIFLPEETHLEVCAYKFKILKKFKSKGTLIIQKNKIQEELIQECTLAIYVILD